MPTQGRLSPLFSWRSAIADSSLHPTARHVALTLSLHMSERGDSCFPSLPTLAKETGLHYDTVRSHLRSLSDQGWLTKRADRSQKGRGTVVVYAATVPTSVVLSTGAQDHVGDDHRGAGPETTGAQDHTPEEGVIEGVISCTKRAERPSDLVFMAVVEACGWLYEEMTERQRTSTAVAVAQLVKVNASPADVLERALTYRQKFPQAALTANALASNWSNLRSTRTKPSASKSSTVTDSAGRTIRIDEDGTETIINPKDPS